MKTFKKILLIFGVIAILSMLLNGFGVFDKLKEKEESKEETPVIDTPAVDETPVETVTFTLYYDENNAMAPSLMNETFTVEKGTTWLEFYNSQQTSNLQPNGELSSNPTFCYCALGSVYHFSDLENAAKMNDEIKSGTYGALMEISISSSYESKTYQVVKGMTWTEFVSYDTTDGYVYIDSSETGNTIWFMDSALNINPDSRILISSYSKQ